MIDSRAITTDRLVMTPHDAGDYPDMVRMWADPQVVRFIGGQPFNAEDTWARLLRHAGTWAMMDFGMWAVRHGTSGAYLGAVGYLEAKRTGVQGFDGDPEIGWSLNVAAHGQGFAGEAVTAALGWGTTAFAGRFTRTVAMIDPGNIASCAVAQRCGFRHFAPASYKDNPTSLWEYRFQ